MAWYKGGVQLDACVLASVALCCDSGVGYCTPYKWSELPLVSRQCHHSGQQVYLLNLSAI